MDWINFIPPDKDVQVSRSQDFEACASYSYIHILEMRLRKQYGLFWEWSERAMAKLSDTQPWGNTLDNVVNAANNYGVLLTQSWPELTYSTNYQNIDWNTYYAYIPNSVSIQAYRVVSDYKKISPSQVQAALNDGPLWTIVKAGSQLHCVAQINEHQFFDSYEIKVKNFSDGYPIVSQHALTIKITNMPNAIFVHKAGTNEYGFYLPSLSEDAVKDKALNLGLPITDANDKVDFSLAKDMTINQ